MIFGNNVTAINPLYARDHGCFLAYLTAKVKLPEEGLMWNMSFNNEHKSLFENASKLNAKVQSTLSPEAIRCYLGNFKTSLLDIIVNERIHINRPSLFDSIDELSYEHLEKLVNEQESLEEIIKTSLPENKWHLLTDYEETLFAFYVIQTENTYKQGLCEGFKLALELLSLKVDLTVDYRKRAIGG